MPRSRAAAAPPAGSVGPSRGQVHVDLLKGRDLLEAQQLLALLDQRLADARLGLAHRALDRGLERAVALEQLRRGLLADALGAGDPVGGVAAQGDEVGHLGGVDPVAPAHLAGVDGLGAAAARADVEHGHAVAGALVHVAVAGHHERAAAGVRLARGVGAEQVVGLERVGLGHDPAEALEEPPRVGELGRQRVGHLGPLGVVAVEQLDAVVGGVRPEAEHHRARGVLLDLAQDQVGGAEQRVDGLAVLALDRIRQRVEGAEQHRGRVDG